ncbi:Cyclin B and related kinase-activating proteins protein [Dioscorea alata]|uniref:Cyclin B and related kinase-activating proteins protein n=1 Tax=Dioscorea alata TaxID=55571 RepID=A0ACB7VSB6_DIOAL|nr:Cyclin B and related kinase-activating proteins protein [Dioscorea alata]
METRHQDVVPQIQKGAAAIPAGKQKNAAVVDGKNRRALEDIGNLVNVRVLEGKPLNQISRPITRSFGAQLLANAQAAAPAANKKPVTVVAGDGAVVKGGVKAVKQKQAVKPSKPEAVITISPDTEEEAKHATLKNSHGTSSKKKVHTLTSVLTARSKAACGVVDKPKDQVEDIDALDADDQLAVADYVEDIYKFYKHSESSYRPHDYMDTQLEINAKMRSILADWLIEVHYKFELMPETLYLTFYIIDRYLSMKAALRRELQLVGVSAMLIASKYEEIWAPEVNDFICISDKAYTREQILAMEKEILNELEWNLTVPTPYVFLVRFLKASQRDEEMENMVFFFAELAMVHYSMVKYCPSMLAASAVYAARCTLNKSPLWSETLKCHTGFSEPELLECTKMLVNFHSLSAESKLKVVHKKYSSSQRCAVALQLPVVKMFEGLKVSE